VRLARSEKPGACHIELPEDVAKMPVSAQPLTPRRFPRPIVDPSQINHAFQLLKAAKRPIILVGNGCIRRQASPQLRTFCEQTGIGVINTFMAKGCVDMDADYALFTVGLQAKDVISCALDASDLVITLGYDMVEYHPKLWNSKLDKHIIHADFEPAEIDTYYHPEIELVGDLAHTLSALSQCIQDNGGAVTRDLQQQHNTRKAMFAEIHAHDHDDTQGYIRPQKVLADVRQVMGADDILLSDVGAHKMWIARHYHCHQPNTCLIPNGFCSMGFALPAGIGASLLYPDKRILSICGDAGFLMNVQDMETAKRLNSNLVVMVWEDHAYGLIAWKQQNQFGKHTDLSFNNPDWMMLAQSFAWHGFTVANSKDLIPTLEKAFTAQGPSLIVLPIDYRENMILTQRLGDIACPI
jgi:acetolactate synthase-1/2/3 large subunit